MGYNTKYEHDIQVMADLANESAHYVSCDSVYSTATVHLSSHLRWSIANEESCATVIEDRKANPTDKNDLLNRMLKGKDPKTGKTLSDDNIKNNVCMCYLVHYMRLCLLLL